MELLRRKEMCIHVKQPHGVFLYTTYYHCDHLYYMYVYWYEWMTKTVDLPYITIRDCLLYHLFSLTWTKLRIPGTLWGETHDNQWILLYGGPFIRKMTWYYDVTLILLNATSKPTATERTLKYWKCFTIDLFRCSLETCRLSRWHQWSSETCHLRLAKTDCVI